MRKSGTFLLTLAALSLLPALAHAAGETGAAADPLADGVVLAFLGALWWGFLTSLTPCVYPMIPIIVAVFGARDESVTRRKAMLLATSFVLGISTLYTTLGVGFALAGSQANQLLSNPYVIIPIALILVALATSMFGAFEIRLPYGLQQKLNQVGGKGYRGAYMLGLVLGVIAAPCTGAFAATIFLMVARTGDPLAGGALMFTYSIGMGALFWVLAVFALALPKSGAWMETVKSVCGIVLIVMAGYFLIPIFPAIAELSAPSYSFLGGAIFVAVIGFLIGAAHLSFHGKPAEKLRKAVGVTLAVAGLLGAVNWYLTPDREVEWRHDEAAAFAEARETNKHVMIDFGADWCLPCKEIEKIVGDDDLYEDITGSFVPLKFDVSEQDDEDEALQEKYDAPVLPAVIFVDADGNEIGRYTNKNPSASSFRAKLREIAAANPL